MLTSGVTSVVAGLAAATVTSATAPTLVPDEAPAGRPLFKIEAPAINEVSGVATDPDGRHFYVHEDASGAAEVYVLDLTGRTRTTLKLPYPNEDWEDIAVSADAAGTASLFVADTGDAYFVRDEAGRPPRTRYSVLQAPRPDLRTAGPVVEVPKEQVVRYEYVFADRATHNAETLLVQPRTNRVFVVDKNEKASGTAYLWSGPETASATEVNEFTQVAQVPIMGASGGSFAPAGDRFVVRDATTAYIWQVRRGDVAAALRTRPVVVALPPQPQGEGVAFTPDGRSLVIGSEGGQSTLWEVPLPAEALAATALSQDASAQVRDDGSQTKVVLVALAATAALAALAGVWVVGLLRRRRLA